MKGRLLIVDDDIEMQSLLKDYFSSIGYVVETTSHPGQAIELAERLSPEVIITDLRMPEMSGMDLISQIRAKDPFLPVVLITAFGTVETAIEAMKKGAYDYIVKPFKISEIILVVERAQEYYHLKHTSTALKKELYKSWSRGSLIGKSHVMKEVFDLVSRVAGASANVLITGESGTGKEVIARAIHNSGPRAKKPFVAINCTAIPEALLESELFGHAKGSFTGAHQRKAGLFEEAGGGTIFLDEIGDMPLSLQAKLLRVLQDRKIRAVGDTTDKEIDVRILAATHKDLKAAIREGNFREDLYYRLSVIPISIPPLRARKEDIAILAEHFLRKYALANQSGVKGFTREAIKKLMEAKWEGNVRELENVVERAIVLARGEYIDGIDLPQLEAFSGSDFFTSSTQDFPTLEQLEKRYIERVLEKTGGRKERASHILGINRRTLYRKEREYGLVPEGLTEEAYLEQPEALPSGERG